MRLTRTERMSVALQHASQCPELRQCERELWRGMLAEEGVPHTALADLAAHIRGCPRWRGTDRWAHELAAGAAPLLPPPQSLEEAGEQSKTALRARLQAAIDDRQYRAMVSNVASFPKPHSAATAAVEAKIAREQLYMAINLLIAMAACFVAGYYLGGRLFGTREASYICGAVGLVLSLFVEAVLLIITMSRQETYEAKLRGTAPPPQRARKVIVPNLGPVPVPVPVPLTSAAAKKAN